MAEPYRYFVGLDLGQASDFTALAVLERSTGGSEGAAAQRRPVYALRHLRRFPLGTPYAEVVDEVRGLLRTPPLPGAFLVVDQTGVGQAVVALLAEELRNQVTCTFCPVTLTTGHGVTIGDNGGVCVPKKELVSVLQVLLQLRRLQVARTLPDALLLVRELEHFRVKVPTARTDTFESWREGQHDDLVFAVALAAWVGEQVGLSQPDSAHERGPITVSRMP
jgi:hypothetical protein